MSYNDKLITRFDGQVSDEMERRVLHESSSVAMYWASWTLLIVGAILAYVLPGYQTYWSLLVFAPLVVAEASGRRWSKHYIPTPRMARTTAWEYATAGAIALVWFIGLNISTGDPILSGFVVPVLAAVLVVLYLPKAVARRRADDKARLDDELDHEV